MTDVGIVSTIRGWFAPQSLRAKVDAAQTNAANSEHWAMADALSADGAYTLAVRKKVRERARYEVLNNGYARGIVRTHANAVIGTGPRLQVLLDDDDLSATVEASWTKWVRKRRLVEKLRAMRMAQTVDGEAFALLGTGDDVEGVELDVYPIETDQVTFSYGSQLQSLTGNPDGIELDVDGEIIRYHVLRQHPGDVFRNVPYESEPIAASQMIHLFRAERPGQHRGLSELTPALGLFAILRRYTLATLTSAETAAAVAGILRTNSTAIDPAEVDPWEEVAIRHGAMVTLPDGWSMEQFKAENPNTGYESFKKAVLSEIARCINMPYNVAAADSSDHNYSSGRLDHQVYGKEVSVDQDYYERECLDRIFASWLDEAVLAGLLPVEALAAADDHEWHWDPLEDIDPQKTASARQTNLTTGMTSYATEYAVDGRDWRTEFAKQAECLGMTFEQYQYRLANAIAPPEAAAAVGADAGATVQETALNGAQIASLLEIITQVSLGQIPLESAKPIIQSAFPAMADPAIDAILAPLSGFAPRTLPDGTANPAAAASDAGDATPVAEFGGLSRMQWQRNRKAIRDVLDGLISGTETPASAQLFLESIGLSADKAAALIEDTQDKVIDDPALQETP